MPQLKPLAEGLRAAREVARKDELLPSMSSAAGSGTAHRHARKALMVQPGGNIAPVGEADTSHPSWSDFSILNSELGAELEVTGKAAILEHGHSLPPGFYTKSRLGRMAANQRLHSLPSWHATQRHQPVAAASNLVAPVLPVAAPALVAAASSAPEGAVAAGFTQTNVAMDPSILLAFVCGALVVLVLVLLGVLFFSTEQIAWLRQKLLQTGDNHEVRGVRMSQPSGVRMSMADGEYWNPEMSENSEEEYDQPTREASSKDMDKGSVTSGFLWKLANDVVRSLPKESWEKMLERPLEIAEWTSWRIRYFNIKVCEDGGVDMSYLSEKDDLIPITMQLSPLQISGKLALELPSVNLQGDDETRLATMASVDQYKLSIETEKFTKYRGGTLPDVLYLLLVSGTKPEDGSGKKNRGKEQYHVYGAESHEQCLEWIANIEASGQRDM